ncbi:MAG: DUF4388 domain-containing protein [Myxococcota bacterium]
MKDATDELVRIDDSGAAHPIGARASQRMRDRVGAYRVLPAPDHLVFMRYTGEDGRRDAEDGAIVRLAGEITAPAALCDILAMMEHCRWRGELQVRSGETVRSIFTENGNVVGATTNEEAERLGRVMYRFGALDAEALETVLKKVETDGGRFGEIVAAMGYASAEDVYHFVGKQIAEIVYGALEVEDGTFFFLDGFEGDRLVSHHTLGTSMLLMDGVTRLDEIRYFRARIPSSDWVPVATDRGEVPKDPICSAVYGVLDGRRSVAEIGRLTGYGDFETTKALYTLLQSKHVDLHPPRIGGGAAAIVEAANAALRPIHQRVDQAGVGTSFRRGLAEFATGAGFYDVLFLQAGPDARGGFDAVRVAENLTRLAGDDDEAILMDKLHEYVSFAIFNAGSLLGQSAESGLVSDVQPILARLQPQG